VGLSLGRDRYYRYMTAFGFGSPTGIGLAGESRGLLRDPQRWSALSLPTMSIGQEVSVTALQMVAAFGAIANGGVLMQPRLVRSLFDAEGRETRRFEPRAVRQVVSPETAHTLTRLMTQVVAAGTGHNAAIAGYEVAGKTGTAQKLDPVTRRYSRTPGVLSFVGFAPADEPRIVMLVMLDEPKNEKWGSEAAAPIFSAIGAEVLRYLDVPPRDVAPLAIVTGDSSAGRVRPAGATATEPAIAEGAPVMPELRGRTLRQALTTLAPLGVAVLFERLTVLRPFLLGAAFVAVIVAPSVKQGCKTAFVYGRSLAPDQSVAWIEANIPPGTPVYVDSGQFRALLPTQKAADRLWADVASPYAWKEKYRHDMARFGLDEAEPLRVMSADRMAADLGNRRRFYILGSAGQPERPRYDIRSISYGSFFDLPPKAAIQRLCDEGGTYLHSGAAIADLPAPAMSWVRPDGNSTFVYRVAAGGCGR